MNEPNPQPTAPSARPPNYFGWITTGLLVIPALAMAYVSIALVYPPLQNNAAIFAALTAAPQWIQIEWYAATVIGLYALFSVRRGALLSVIATALLAVAYIHLHLALLGNMSIPAWLAVLAAVSALIAAVIAAAISKRPRMQRASR